MVRRAPYSVTLYVGYCLTCFINLQYLIQSWLSVRTEEKCMELPRKINMTDFINFPELVKNIWMTSSRKVHYFLSDIFINSAFRHMESRINTTDCSVFHILLYSASSVCLLLYWIPSRPFPSYYASYCYPLFSVFFFSPFVLISFQPFLFISHVFVLFLRIFSRFTVFLIFPLLRHVQTPYNLFRTKSTRKEIFW